MTGSRLLIERVKMVNQKSSLGHNRILSFIPNDPSLVLWVAFAGILFAFSPVFSHDKLALRDDSLFNAITSDDFRASAVAMTFACVPTLIDSILDLFNLMKGANNVNGSSKYRQYWWGRIVIVVTFMVPSIYFGYYAIPAAQENPSIYSTSLTANFLSIYATSKIVILGAVMYFMCISDGVYIWTTFRAVTLELLLVVQSFLDIYVAYRSSSSSTTSLNLRTISVTVTVLCYGGVAVLMLLWAIYKLFPELLGFILSCGCCGRRHRSRMRRRRKASILTATEGGAEGGGEGGERDHHRRRMNNKHQHHNLFPNPSRASSCASQGDHLAALDLVAHDEGAAPAATTGTTSAIAAAVAAVCVRNVNNKNNNRADEREQHGQSGRSRGQSEGRSPYKFSFSAAAAQESSTKRSEHELHASASTHSSSSKGNGDSAGGAVGGGASTLDNFHATLTADDICCMIYMCGVLVAMVGGWVVWESFGAFDASWENPNVQDGLLASLYYVFLSVVLLMTILPSRMARAELMETKDMLMTSMQTYVRYLSHELRTPLNTAFLGLNLAMASLQATAPLSPPPSLPPNQGREPQQQQQQQQEYVDDQMELLRDISSSCGTALKILNDLLTYDKLESGMMQASLQETNTVAFVLDASKPFAVDAKEKGVDLVLQCGSNRVVRMGHQFRKTDSWLEKPDPNPNNHTTTTASGHTRPVSNLRVVTSADLRPEDVMFIDKSKMNQVICNLISNALKFSSPGATVTVSAKASFGVDESYLDVEEALKNPNIKIFSRAEALAFVKSMMPKAGSMLLLDDDHNHHPPHHSNAAPAANTYTNITLSCRASPLSGGGGGVGADGGAIGGTNTGDRAFCREKTKPRIPGGACNGAAVSIRMRPTGSVTTSTPTAGATEQPQQGNHHHSLPVPLSSTTDGATNRDHHPLNENAADREQFLIGVLTISVTDSGIGIAPEKLKSIFKQFNPKELQTGGSSGLGLWISKGIIDLHGGKIRAKSEGGGRGSTFSVIVPVFRRIPFDIRRFGISRRKSFDMNTVRTSMRIPWNMAWGNNGGASAAAGQQQRGGGGRVVAVTVSAAAAAAAEDLNNRVETFVNEDREDGDSDSSRIVAPSRRIKKQLQWQLAGGITAIGEDDLASQDWSSKKQMVVDVSPRRAVENQQQHNRSRRQGGGDDDEKEECGHRAHAEVKNAWGSSVLGNNGSDGGQEGALRFFNDPKATMHDIQPFDSSSPSSFSNRNVNDNDCSERGSFARSNADVTARVGVEPRHMMSLGRVVDSRDDDNESDGGAGTDAPMPLRRITNANSSTSPISSTDHKLSIRHRQLDLVADTLPPHRGGGGGGGSRSHSPESPAAAGSWSGTSTATTTAATTATTTATTSNMSSARGAGGMQRTASGLGLVDSGRRSKTEGGGGGGGSGSPLIPTIDKIPRVLVVDDSLLTRKMMCKTLRITHCQCDEAVDGIDAVAKASRRNSLVLTDRIASSSRTDLSAAGTAAAAAATAATAAALTTTAPAATASNSGFLYDFILMDFMMPNMDGPSATRELRMRGYQGAIIGVTGNVLPADVEYFQECGADAVLAKPLSIDALRDVLAAATGGGCGGGGDTPGTGTGGRTGTGYAGE